MEKVNLDEGFDSFDEQWAPRLAAEANGQAVKLAKVDGTFTWHRHDDADELFFVVDGTLKIELRGGEDIVLEEGEFVVVPRGTDHRPVAPDGETRILLFEPVGTSNTGTADNERTKEIERL